MKTANMTIPAPDMPNDEAREYAFRMAAEHFLCSWADKQKSSKHLAFKRRAAFDKNPEDCVTVVDEFYKSIRWLCFWVTLTTFMGFITYVNIGNGYWDLGFAAICAVLGLTTYIQIDGDVIGKWPGFTAFAVRKDWIPVRRTLVETYACVSLESGLQYGRLQRFSGKAETREGFVSGIRSQLKEFANNITKAEASGHPLQRRKLRKKFSRLFTVAVDLKLLDGKQWGDFFPKSI